jgi:hypothetical protein
MKPIKGDIRADGKRYDGHTWREMGTNHHMNDEGLVFYKNEHRTVEGYLKQGGTMDKIVFKNTKVKDISALVKALYDKEEFGDVYAIWNPSFPEWIKVGKAIDAYDRCNGYQTSSPFRDYTVVARLPCENRHEKEKEMHKIFEHFSEQRNGEWFKIEKLKAIKLFNIQNQGDTIAA